MRLKVTRLWQAIKRVLRVPWNNDSATPRPLLPVHTRRSQRPSGNTANSVSYERRTSARPAHRLPVEPMMTGSALQSHSSTISPKGAVTGSGAHLRGAAAKLIVHPAAARLRRTNSNRVTVRRSHRRIFPAQD